MALWRKDGFAENLWTDVADGEALPRSGAIIVSALRWSVERRLAFVEERLFWIGKVNRTDLVRRFGVSMSQASGDIARYLALDPPGLVYDKSAKHYVAGEDFRPVLAAPEAGRFLGELRLVDLGILPLEDTSLGVLRSDDAAAHAAAFQRGRRS